MAQIRVVVVDRQRTFADALAARLDLEDDVAARAVAPGVIMLGATSEAERIVHGLRAGAVAWVGKDESIELLLHVVRGAGRGEAWLPPAALARVLRLLPTEQDERRSND